MSKENKNNVFIQQCLLFPVSLRRASLLSFWASNMSVKGQKALGFHQKYLNLCSEDKEGLTGLEVHVINNRIFIIG